MRPSTPTLRSESTESHGIPHPSSYTYLLVLQVTVLALDGVQLIAECEEVLVPLLDLEDLSLQLRDQQVLLV